MPLYSADPVIILGQGGAALAHTGNTNQTVLATIPVPGGLLGANGQIEIISLWSFTNSANNKTLSAYLGATNLLAVTATTSATLQVLNRIANRNNPASQAFFTPFSTSGLQITANALSTAAVDTNAASEITFRAQLANAGESISLESYIVKAFPRE